MKKASFRKILWSWCSFDSLLFTGTFTSRSAGRWSLGFHLRSTGYGIRHVHDSHSLQKLGVRVVRSEAWNGIGNWTFHDVVFDVRIESHRLNQAVVHRKKNLKAETKPCATYLKNIWQLWNLIVDFNMPLDEIRVLDHFNSLDTDGVEQRDRIPGPNIK